MPALGYIGLEMADALTHRGIEVTVACRPATVLSTVDAEYGNTVAAELQRHGVKVSTSVEVHRISRAGDHIHVSGSNHFDQDCEMVIVAVGVNPNAALGAEAGLDTGAKGALVVNRRMESNLGRYLCRRRLWGNIPSTSGPEYVSASWHDSTQAGAGRGRECIGWQSRVRRFSRDTSRQDIRSCRCPHRFAPRRSVGRNFHSIHRRNFSK